jgi:hypothetical protein
LWLFEGYCLLARCFGKDGDRRSPLLDFDDLWKIRGQGVAGGEDYEFAAVEDNPLFPFPDRLSSVFFALGVKANF